MTGTLNVANLPASVARTDQQNNFAETQTFSAKLRLSGHGSNCFIRARGTDDAACIDVRSIASFASTSIPLGVDSIELLGYYAEGDGGAATYRRVATEPAHPAKLQSSDGTWWELAEPFPSLKQFGATMDGVTSDRLAWQKAIDWAKNRNGAIIFPPGNSLVDGELNFCGATTGISIIGAGSRQSRILVTAFGADKAVFNGCNPDTNTRNSQNNHLSNFEITSSSGTVNVDHPIGILLPYSAGDLIENVRIRSLGNTAVWTSSANNTRLRDVWAVGGGFHYTEDDNASLSATFSGTAGAATVNASAAVFLPAHVGKNFYIEDAGTSGFAAAHTIIAVAGDGLSATLDRPIVRTFSAQKASFEGIKATVLLASLNTLTSNIAVFRSADVGRWIYIEGAGEGQGLHVTKIASYVSPTQVTLTDSAINAVGNEFFYLTPANFHGTISADNANTRKLNDIVLERAYVESYQSLDYVFRDGVNVWCRDCKSHGLGGATRVGRNVRSIIVDAVRSFSWHGGEFDYGYAKDSGNILITGSLGSYSFSEFQASSLPENQSFFDFNSSSANSSLVIGDGHYNKVASLNPALVVYSSGAVSDANVRFSGYVVGRDASSFNAHNGSSVASSFIVAPKLSAMTSTNSSGLSADAFGHLQLVLRNASSTLTTFLGSGSSTASYFNGGNVGIGTTTPAFRLSVVGNAHVINSAATIARFERDSSANASVELTNTIGSMFVGVIQTTADFAVGTSNGLNSSAKLTVQRTSGNVGIGTSTPSAQLHTTGTVRFSNFGAGSLQTDANGNLSVSSDERLKHVNGDFTRGLADVLNITPINYHWNEASGLDRTTQYAGFSAQNVQAAIPEAIGQDNHGYLTLQDRPLIAALVNAQRTCHDYWHVQREPHRVVQRRVERHRRPLRATLMPHRRVWK